MREQANSTANDAAASAADDRAKSDRSIAQILQEIVHRVSEIVRAEVRLATAEARQDVTERAKAGAFIIIAAVLLFQALGLLLLGAVYALSMVMAAWLSAIAVGVVVALVGGILLYAGQARMKQSPKLELTAQIAEDNVKWLRNQSG